MAEYVPIPVVDIEGNGDIADVCDEIERLLVKSEARIFQRGGLLVRVINDGSERRGINRDLAAPRIVPFDDLSFAEVITRHLEIRRRNRKTHELVSVDCPRVIAQTLLARREWAFPTLEAVVEHPIMLPDGEVLWESQYHAPTGLLLDLPDYSFLSPERSPSIDYALESLLELQQLLSGFDFVDALDESVALAFLMTPFVRPVLQTAPAFGIDAHAAGSGKSTLIRVVSRISSGREPAFLTFGDDPAELKKLLFAALLEGDQQIAIDNVDMPVTGAELAVILTSPMYRGRVLGQSVNASVPTKALISLNGNNLQIVGDLTRRVLVSRLDPTCERPAERVFSFDPIAEAIDMRSEYVYHAITIMQAYMASGDRVDVRPFGSFEVWSRLVREALIWMGLPDPVDSIRVLEESDPERTQLRSVLMAVRAVKGTAHFKAADLLFIANAKHGSQQDMASTDAFTDDDQVALREGLQAVCERNGELNARALGKWLLRMKGRIEGGFRFLQVRQTSVVSIWKVEPVE